MDARTSYAPSLSRAWRDMGFNKFIAARKGISAKAVTPMDVEPPNRKVRLVESSQKSLEEVDFAAAAVPDHTSCMA